MYFFAGFQPKELGYELAQNIPPLAKIFPLSRELEGRQLNMFIYLFSVSRGKGRIQEIAL